MNKTHLRFCLAITLLMACTSLPAGAGELNDKNIVGVWFGARQQKATKTETQEICHFKSDGSFSISFRRIKDGQLLEEQNESGRWELNGNLKTMVTTHINGKQLDASKYIIDKYLMIEVTDSDMRYEHMKSGAKFRLTRVKEGFKFP